MAKSAELVFTNFCPHLHLPCVVLSGIGRQYGYLERFGKSGNWNWFYFKAIVRPTLKVCLDATANGIGL